MKKLKKFLSATASLLAAALGAAFVAGCQYEVELSPGEKSDLTVDELVAKTSVAMDPEGNYKKAKSYILKQKVVDASQFERDEYSLEIKFKRPDFMKYSTFHGEKASSILVFDGSKAWNINPITKASIEISEGTGMNLVKTFAALAKPGSTVKAVFKTVDIDMARDQWNVLCYRLVCRVEDKNIAPYIILVGPDYLTRSIETVCYTADGSKVKYLSESKNYAWISGIKMATESIVQSGDKVVHSYIVSFTLNPDIPDNDFKLPSPWFDREPVLADEGKSNTSGK